MPRRALLACTLALHLAVPAVAEAPRPLKILFLGDNGGHRPAERFRQLEPVLAARGIDLTYTDKIEALNPQTLSGYDGLLIYANTTRITPEQKKALLDYVEGGKGFIPLHRASFCFQNSPKYIALVGAQFKSHNTGTFRTVIAEPNHPVMKGFHGFESWDETYVHTKHNEKDRTVLEYRKEGDKKEPWTWVRTQGKGRVLYTAWGHDELRENIDELRASPKSLMPEGFEKQVSETDLTNLLEFLTHRGKYLPIPLEKAAIAVSTRGLLTDENSRAERLAFSDWKPKTFDGVPFNLIDPQGDKTPNVVMLYSKNGKLAEKMPKAVSVPCNAPARAIHLLSGVSGWGYDSGDKGTVSMVIRLHYADGKTEHHELINGEHFADYSKRTDVPGSKFAFDLGGKQVRYLALTPQRKEKIEKIEFVKGRDNTAPIVMAVTVEIGE